MTTLIATFSLAEHLNYSFVPSLSTVRFHCGLEPKKPFPGGPPADPISSECDSRLRLHILFFNDAMVPIHSNQFYSTAL